MKRKSLRLAGLLLIGSLGASSSANAATIDNSISGANIATIAQISENKSRINNICNIAERNRIDGAIFAGGITSIQIEQSEISNKISRIALGNLIDTDIQAIRIDAGITDILAQ